MYIAEVVYRHIRKRIFAYSDRVNLDTSQKLYQNNVEGCLLWYCIRIYRNTSKVGLSFPYLYNKGVQALHGR